MSGRLLIVGLATSLDRYAWLPQLRLGAINRPREVLVRAGGKGLNAARAASGLGVRVRSVSLAGGETGQLVRALAPPLDVRFVDSGAETRQCLCLLGDDAVLTEVYEPVLPVSSTIWPSVLSAVADEIEECDLVALSGRVPPGLPVDALAEIVDLAVARRVPVVVDSDGPSLIEAIRRGPTLVKVNAAEAAAAAPGDLSQLQKLGAKSVVVTTGPTGARFLGADGSRLTVSHDAIPNALPVGSGDAFLAGLTAVWLGGSSGPPFGGLSEPAEALRVAAAAARANARRLPAGDISWDQVKAELSAVRISAI
ncbi:PfkB family carbohydrate kinase [Micromonospora sp. NPDC052213]|uniref:PfkB family carbohydrate kinase n=1 Tax=Micromonospora sp. NPDC052213 TaxID=3155812 RepID=UPI0034292FF1